MEDRGMAIGVEIRFTGLCTFGPVQNHGTPFRSVMLVNARDSDKEAHVAAILAPFANLDRDDQNARDFDFRFDGTLADFGSDDMVGFLLKGEQLTLPNLLGAALSLAPGPAANAECPVAGDKEGFGWVASLKKAEDASPVDDALTGTKKSVLLARLRLEKGLLSTDKFVEYDGKIVKWKDHLSDPSKERPIAEVVKLTGVSIDADRLHIHSVPFSGSAPDVILKGNKVSFWLVNMPILDIVGPDRTPNRPPKADAHYHHHYHLTDKPNGKNPKPANTPPCPPVVAVASSSKKDDNQVVTASNPKCPPTSFEA
jgi:hypothetical protein